MPPGRPRNYRPLLRKPSIYRELARECLDELLNKPAAERTEKRMFLIELLDTFLALDEKTTARLEKIEAAVMESESIPEPTKQLVGLLCDRHDITDARGREQIISELAGILKMRPLEGGKGHGGDATLRTPGGAAVTKPSASQLRAAK